MKMLAVSAILTVAAAAGLTTLVWNAISDLNAAKSHSRAWGALACDLNNDGLDDIVVAAWLYDQPEQDEGVVFGYYSLLRAFLPLIQHSP